MTNIITSLSNWINYLSLTINNYILHYLGNQFTKINRYKAKGNKQMADHFSSKSCLYSATQISETDGICIYELKMNDWEFARLKSNPIDGLSAVRKIMNNMFSPGWTRSENDSEGF